MESKQRNQIIVGVIVVLVFVSVCSIGYRIIDGLFFSYIKGSMVISTGQPQNRTVTFNTCHFLSEPSVRSLVLSDGKENGVRIPIFSGQPERIIPILEGKELVSSDVSCVTRHSTLEMVKLVARTHRLYNAWIAAETFKGQIIADCKIPDGQIQITADMHACY